MASDCGLERRQPMAVGTQDIGQDIGIAWVALGGDGAIARPASLYDIGMDWRDKEPGIDETIDDEAARALDGDRCLRRRSPSPKPGDKIGKPIKIMRYQEAFEDFTGAIEHADGVARSAPVETDEYGHIGSPASSQYDPLCRESLREAHQSALWANLGGAARGASSCRPLQAPGHRNAAGLMRAFERQATLAVITAARNRRHSSP